MQYFLIVHERKRYFNWLIASGTVFSRGKYSMLHALWKMKHSSVLSSCMASYNNIRRCTFVYTMVSHTIRLFDFGLFAVTLDLHPDSAITVILSATVVIGSFLHLLRIP